MPIICSRCGTLMKAEAELEEHVQANSPCQFLPQALRGIPPEVVAKLKKINKAIAGKPMKTRGNISIHCYSPIVSTFQALVSRILLSILGPSKAVSVLIKATDYDED